MGKISSSTSAKRAATTGRKQAKAHQASVDEQGDLSETIKEPRKQTNSRYFLFKMKGDKEDVFIAGSDNAVAFRNNFGDLIEKEKGFANKKTFKAFKKQHNNPRPDPQKQRSGVARKAEEDKRLQDEVVARLNQVARDNADRIEAYWKTTSSSTYVAMVIRFASQYGDDAWCVKPEFISEVLCTYAQVAHIKDTQLHEALLNMSIARASDPDNNDKRVPRCILYKPPSDPQKAYRIESHRCYTMISIPFSTLANQNEEETWIRYTIERVLRGIKTIMSSDTFKGILQKIGKNRRAHYIAKLYSACSKSNLPKFLSGTLIRVLPIRFFY